MLTADLLRVRDNGREVVPRYLKLDGEGAGRLVERADQLADLFTSHAAVRGRHGELEEAIKDMIGDGTDYLLTRGLTKLLEDRCTFETTTVVEPPWVRDRLFAMSAEAHPVVSEVDVRHTTTREMLVERLVEQLRDEGHGSVGADDIEEALYGDLPANQRLVEFRPLTGRALLERYNLALAQATLFRADRLTIRLTKPRAARSRQLFRYMKFYRLMHRVTQCGRQSWELVLDGPLSLFKGGKKYGLQMALFLPALVLATDWELEADLRWGTDRQPRVFRLSSDSGLVSHYRDKGVYITEEQKHLERQFRKLKSKWKVSRTAKLINLGGKTILSPDLTFTHVDDGRTALLEIVGYWRRAWLAARIEILAQLGPDNLILAVSDRMRTGEAAAEGAGPGGVTVHTFKGVIVARRILEIVEKVAT